jgi:surfeit locus 1 family protein
MTRTRFRPPPWAIAATLLATALFAALGAWQLGRGLHKQRLLEAVEQPTAPVQLTASTEPSAPPRRAVATGRLVGDRQLLQDGQSRNGVPGYHVWTPLELADGGIVIVDRGWVPQPAPADIGIPSREVSVSGMWRALPEPGIKVGGQACAPAGSFPAVVVYPDALALDCLLGRRVARGLLLLDPGEPGGFVREWAAPGLPPVRHYAYAVQWLALAVTAVALFVKLNLKRIP